jgi:hypothetical protein
MVVAIVAINTMINVVVIIVVVIMIIYNLVCSYYRLS